VCIVRPSARRDCPLQRGCGRCGPAGGHEKKGASGARLSPRHGLRPMRRGGLSEFGARPVMLFPSWPGRRWLRATPLPGLRRRGPLNLAIVAALALAIATTVPDARRMGTALHLVLPAAALACGAVQGHVIGFLGRFAALGVGIHLPKRSLGDHPVNLRPDGDSRGFPSAHTAAATFGAVHLVYHCAGLHPGIKGLVLMAAGIAGGSRIETDRHTLWQTIAGAALGWGMAVLSLRLLRCLVRPRNRTGGA
jgi:membrane-associated phospholipid phosphatase